MKDICSTVLQELNDPEKITNRNLKWSHDIKKLFSILIILDVKSIKV